jgi:hypothetical protein
MENRQAVGPDFGVIIFKLYYWEALWCPRTISQQNPCITAKANFEEDKSKGYKAKDAGTKFHFGLPVIRKKRLEKK